MILETPVPQPPSMGTSEAKFKGAIKILIQLMAAQSGKKNSLDVPISLAPSKVKFPSHHASSATPSSDYYLEVLAIVAAMDTEFESINDLKVVILYNMEKVHDAQRKHELIASA
ncbi:hypothetical protein HAX54_053259 [Datura stramonium]|uniref:Uncharacterized protein n=1 Tax=Datura stramonium TaxID=4076 RepID=A0ABS8T043_DATST|nr:hypothetical protein [Datura stramonium]